MTPTGFSPKASKRELWAWASYDWANSAYSTLSITVVMLYLRNVAFANSDYSGAIYPATLAISMITAALLSPLVGALADARANKRWWLAGTALSGAACALATGLIPLDAPWLIAVAFAFTSFFFELSYGFYNAFLPELADEQSMDRVSAFGFACGYVGGGLALVLQILIFKFGENLGLHTLESQCRAGLLLMGLWWGLFSLPSIIILRDKSIPRSRHMAVPAAARQAAREVATTIRNIRQYRILALFLVGYLFYNDCVQTVISQASQLGQELNFEPQELVLVILLIQFVALPGALLMGRLSERLGQTRVLHICLAVWSLLLVSAWFINTKLQFWILGGVVALVMGGIQSVSRAIMGTMTPPERTAEFFGFFNLSSKATSFIGTGTFAVIMYYSHNNVRLSLVSLLAQLIIGWLIVSRVHVAQGRQQALASSRAALNNPTADTAAP